MVDEFQDTNRVQLELIERLRGPETRLFMVGDEHQSIYRFRNADLEVFRGERARPAMRRRHATCCRCAGTSARARRCSPRSNEVGATLLDGFAELTAGRDAERPAPGAVELLLTLDEGRGKDARKWKRRGDRPRAAAVGSAPRTSPRPASWPSACASWSTPARSSGARSSSCCGRSPTSTPTRRRCARAGLEPVRGRRARLLVPAAGRGPGPAARRASPTRSTTSSCSAPWPRPPCAVSPDALWLLRRAASDEAAAAPRLAG